LSSEINVNNIRIGEIFTDRILGKMLYIGRIGYELNMPQICKLKGRHIFVGIDIRYPTLIPFTKKNIQELQKIK
jgi:hypothetical protein